MTNHNTKDCQKAPPDSTSSSTLPTTESRKCYYCARQGRLGEGCRFKKAALELRKSNKKTTTNSDTTTAIASVAAANDVAPYSFS